MNWWSVGLRQKLETLWNSQLNELLAKKKNNNEAKKETNEAIEKYKIQSAQGLALRMLIADIQHVKATDGLCGMTPEEEYQDYLQRYLSSAEHVQKLCGRYPELVRVTEQVMEQAEAFLQEFLQRFECLPFFFCFTGWKKMKKRFTAGRMGKEL